MAMILPGPAVSHPGSIVEVLYEMPRDDFVMPDGSRHYGLGRYRHQPLTWVVRYANRRLESCIRDDGSQGLMEVGCGCVEDKYLRPLRDPGEADPSREVREKEVEA
jgi:hypothetical protein